ncbi:MAG: lipoprotein-releasing ABC transporter permease subunit [Acidobacteria bacterium]|nr:lipoprotein-releasing ABC transporter permease subunit [Acidobacteriota bacterium]
MTDMPFELQVALRYLLAKRRQVFISVISLVSTLGVMVGVMALVIALALMTGLQYELRDRILGSAAHVYVWKPVGLDDYRAEIARIESVDGVVSAAPALLGKALITGPGGEGFITIKGIDPAREGAVTDLGRSMVDGDLADLAPASDERRAGVLIGRALAATLGVQRGDTVTLVTPQGALTPMGMMPRQRRVDVAGTFTLGLFEFDQAYGFVDLETAYRLTGQVRPDHMEIRVADIYQAAVVADTLQRTLGAEYVTQHWSEMNQSLYSALWLEKMAMGIGIGLIVMVAALNIVASLVLLVMEKTRDIAILKTMGASSRSIMLIFLMQGMLIGIIGTLTGAALGVGIATVLDRYRVITIPSDVYQVTYLPFLILPGDVGVVVLGAVVICFLATLYPSRQAARLDPAQALRYE